MSEFQKGLKTFKCRDEKDIGEGEKISLLLEQAAEPEILMADMSSEQLTSFASYQAKIEVCRMYLAMMYISVNSDSVLLIFI